jgi:hypothetical protein
MRDGKRREEYNMFRLWIRVSSAKANLPMGGYFTGHCFFADAVIITTGSCFL